jgi:hypothetical protein
VRLGSNLDYCLEQGILPYKTSQEEERFRECNISIAGFKKIVEGI